MSRYTESAVTETTVPSSWVGLSSDLWRWLRSNCESWSANDSVDSCAVSEGTSMGDGVAETSLSVMIAYSFILARFDRKLTFPYRMASVKTGLPAYAYVILIVGFSAWVLPCSLSGWSRKSPQKRDSRWRWGLLLEAAGYVILWQGPFWSRPLPSWRLALSVLFLALASLLSWTATRALGRYLRFERSEEHTSELQS